MAISYTFLLSELILGRYTGRSTPAPPVMPNGNFLYIPTVRTDTWQIHWQILPQKRTLVDKNGNLRFLLWELILADTLADLPLPPSNAKWQFLIHSYCEKWYLADTLAYLPLPPSNAKWQFLIHSYCENWYLADTLADLTPIEASSGQEWQFQISTVRAHIGRSPGRPTPQ